MTDELKDRHRRMWASGDYPSMVETFLLPLGDTLAEAAGVTSGMRVLDVAAGTGNTALAAAGRGAEVTASDLTPELLEAGRARAEAEGLELEWTPADAEALPFEDHAFDAAISSIGVMFAPHHQAAADELVRVTRPGGTIGLLSWTPEGQIGALLRALSPFAPPPPPGAQPPPLWGTEAHLEELFGERVTWTTTTRRHLQVNAYDTPEDFASMFRTQYGPTIVARANAAGDGREADLDEALDGLMREWDHGGGGRSRFELEYLLAVGTTRSG
jgi:ubiquinone/menaquinone biosynthesis C-methylase UbiE